MANILAGFFLGEFLIWLPKIFIGAIFLIAVILYIFRDKLSGIKLSFFYKLSFLILIGFKVLMAFLLSVAQYYVWNQDQFTRVFIDSVDDKTIFFNYKYGYFLHYVFLHFWLNVLVSVGIAFVFYLFLIFLKKYRERFFDDGEIELGFVSALIAGWPNFIAFIPLAFVFVVLISILRGLFLREAYTTLGWPLLAAALAALIWGDVLISVLNLGVLRV